MTSLVGNDGPNVLVGPGTVRGLGGNDTLITNNYYAAVARHSTAATAMTGSAHSRADTASASFAGTSASVTCGAGADIVFTNAAAPADCERANVGMHVLGARSIGRSGVVRARIDCTDPRGCVMGGLVLKLHGREAGISSPIPVIKIPFGESRMSERADQAAGLEAARHGRSLHVEIAPVPQPTRSSRPR